MGDSLSDLDNLLLYMHSFDVLLESRDYECPSCNILRNYPMLLLNLYLILLVRSEKTSPFCR